MDCIAMRVWKRKGSRRTLVMSRDGAPASQQSAMRRPRVALRYTHFCVAPFLSLLIALVGCGAGTLPITRNPASKLRLEIHISGQYSDRTDVGVLVRAVEDPGHRAVAFADKASLTCNGISIKSRSPLTVAGSGSCSRQPPGGAYRITYTDEHGASTTVNAPVPLGVFAILSPLTGSTVPIPADGPLMARVSLPTPPANGSARIDSVTALCGANFDTCGGVSATVQYTATLTGAAATGSVPLASGAQSDRLATLASGRPLSATPAPPATPTQGRIPTQPATPTPADMSTPTPTPPPIATITQDGTVGTIALRGNYSPFVPNAGEIDIWVEAETAPDPGGFAGATVKFDQEYLSSSITWTR
jgi:hypothetical protein